MSLTDAFFKFVSPQNSTSKALNIHVWVVVNEHQLPWIKEYKIFPYLFVDCLQCGKPNDIKLCELTAQFMTASLPYLVSEPTLTLFKIDVEFMLNAAEYLKRDTVAVLLRPILDALLTKDFSVAEPSRVKVFSRPCPVRLSTNSSFKLGGSEKTSALAPKKTVSPFCKILTQLREGDSNLRRSRSESPCRTSARRWAGRDSNDTAVLTG